MSKNDHPIALELKSLRSAFENYQHAAHVSALQLQRARSDAADASRRVKLLETENDILKREVSYLRSNVEPIQASRQTTELSLALRRLSDKLSFTEQSLLQKTSECLQTTHTLNKSKVELKLMQSNIDSNRTLLKEYLSKESLLTVRCKAAEEEVKMAMAVINDYASLVRSLQRDLTLAKNPDTPPIPTTTTSSSSSSSSASDENSLSTAILDSFQHSRKSLHQLLSEANAETTSLHTEIAHLHNELSVARTDLEAERETCRFDRERLAKALLEIDRYKADDNAAEKMVSRYMRFSQSSIDTLQVAVSSLKTRHAATLATLSTTSEMLTKALGEERTRVSQMRDVLDELTEDISRETFGRRREVSLRLRHVSREELLLESLTNWIRRAEDRYLRIASGNVAEQTPSSSLLSTYNVMMEEARNVLISSDYSESNDSNSESMSNVLLAEHLCSTLKSELEIETGKRLELAKRLGNCYAPQLSAPAPIISKLDRKGQTNVSPEVPSDDSGTSANVDVAQSGSITHPAENLEDIGVASKDSPGSTENHTLNSDPVTQECPPEVADPLKSQILFEEQHATDPKCEKVQKGFTDCHSALQQLRLLLLDKANVLDSQRSLLLNVVLRLDDYCEDARVELEIHIADIERIKRGLQTVNNFLPPSKSSTSTEDLNQLFDANVDNNDLEAFEKKLSDLEHDIVQVKSALYNSESSASVFDTDSPSNLPSKSPTWSLFSSSAPYHDPIPPSFGTVITAPKSRRIYSLAGYASSHDALSLKDPYSRLNLRISMPSQHPPWESMPLTSPLGFKPNSNQLRVTRSASSLYQVGLHSPRRTFDGETPKTPEQPNESVVVDNDHADVE